jgi:hypothetical protein
MASSQKASYEKAKGALMEALAALNDAVTKAKLRLIPLDKMTTETADKIKKFGKDRQICQKLLKSWFRAFLGVKDEAMILITGEIVRAYHIQAHTKFRHERQGESHYYNEGCTLSICSIDGIDYEYRAIANKFGSKSVRRFYVSDATQAYLIILLYRHWTLLPTGMSNAAQN